MKQQILFFVLLLSISSWCFGQTPNVPGTTNSCIDFEDGNFTNWTTISAVSSILTGNPPNSPAAIANIAPNTSNYLHVRDANTNDQGQIAGISYLLNPTINGNLHNGIDKTISFDFAIFNDSYPANNPNNSVNDILYLYQGNINSSTDIIAVFMLNNNTITETSGWMNITAPIALANGNQLPSNPQGQWVMLNNGTATQWNQLITNLTGIAFPVDRPNANGYFEQIGIDNLCIDCVLPTSEFRFTQADNTVGTTNFFCGQDVIFNGSASENYWQHQIFLWSQPIGASPWDWDWVDLLANEWNNPIWNEDLGIINLSDLAASEGITFEAGFRYRVRLRTFNSCGQSDKYRSFTVNEIPYDMDFTLGIQGPITSGDNYSVTATPNPNIVPISHMWKIYNETPDGQGPDFSNPVTNDPFIAAPTMQFDNLIQGVYYRVVHGVWRNGCFNWDWTSRSLTLLLRKNNGKDTYEIVYGDATELDSKDKQLLSEQMNNSNTKKGLKKDNLSNAIQNSIHIFPNPSTKASTIGVETEGISIKYIELMDMSGKQINISSNEIGSNRANFTINEAISSGIYIVRILTEDDNVIMDKLVIK